MIEKGKRYCDRCGKLLTRDNNKCGYELCDSCNAWLEQIVKADREVEQIKVELEMATEALERTRWVPTSEALPKEGELVLISTKWGDVTIAERWDRGYWYIYREFNNGCCNTETDSITAWMPLPKLYKE